MDTYTAFVGANVRAAALMTAGLAAIGHGSAIAPVGVQ